MALGGYEPQGLRGMAASGLRNSALQFSLAQDGWTLQSAPVPGCVKWRVESAHLAEIIASAPGKGGGRRAARMVGGGLVGTALGSTTIKGIGACTMLTCEGPAVAPGHSVVGNFFVEFAMPEGDVPFLLWRLRSAPLPSPVQLHTVTVLDAQVTAAWERDGKLHRTISSTSKQWGIIPQAAVQLLSRHMLVQAARTAALAALFLWVLSWIVATPAGWGWWAWHAGAVAFAAAIVQLVDVLHLLQLGAHLRRRFGARSLFVNGWQSWSFTGTVPEGSHVPRSTLPYYFTGGFHHGGEPPAAGSVWEWFRGRAVSHMFGMVVEPARGGAAHAGEGAGLVAGFLSQRRHFGTLTANRSYDHICLHCDCDGQVLAAGSSVETDWAVLQPQATLPGEPLAAYLDAVGTHNNARCAEEIPVGWCSWYHYFENVSEGAVISNMRLMLDEHSYFPLGVLQLDDGYQTAWGDWFDYNPRFPAGMKSLAAQIKATGLAAGLWMAPLAADAGSKIVREHPDWFLTLNGRPINSGYTHPGKFFRVMDVTKPEVQAHLHMLIRTAVYEWGFSFLKLDFLYAAALPADRHDKSSTRAELLWPAISW